jgi:hypothetical protein
MNDHAEPGDYTITSCNTMEKRVDHQTWDKVSKSFYLLNTFLYRGSLGWAGNSPTLPTSKKATQRYKKAKRSVTTKDSRTVRSISNLMIFYDCFKPKLSVPRYGFVDTFNKRVDRLNKEFRSDWHFLFEFVKRILLHASE